MTEQRRRTRADLEAEVERISDQIEQAARSVEAAAHSGQDAAAMSREAAHISAALARSTGAIVRQAIAEAREALKEARVEIRVDRLTREESRQRTRELLLDAAAEVFSRLGYHGASLEAVAEAAGFTKGAVYSNFATKGELFAALLQRYTEQRVGAQMAALEHISLEQLADASGRMLEEQARERATWDVLQIEFWLAAMRDPDLLALLAEGSDDMYRASGRVLDRKLAEARVTASFTGYELARLVNALGSGLLLQLYLEPGRVEPSLFGRAIRALAGLPPAPSVSATPDTETGPTAAD